MLRRFEHRVAVPNVQMKSLEGPSIQQTLDGKTQAVFVRGLRDLELEPIGEVNQYTVDKDLV